MKKVILLLTILLFFVSTSSVNAQSFEEEPVAFLQKQLTMKLTVTQLKKEIPKGYVLSHATKEVLTFKKIVNGKSYEITYGIEATGDMYMFIYQAHSKSTSIIIEELKKLEYNFDAANSGMMMGVKLISYKNIKLGYSAILTQNDREKELTVILSNKGYN